MSLFPKKKNLPIDKLAACFNNTSATYKFYWFLSIIEAVERGEERISKRQLFAGMITNAWHPINYFKVSFGKQDRLQRAIEYIQRLEGLSIDASRLKVLETLSETSNKMTIAQLNHFNQQVPHRFLQPWFPEMKKVNVYKASAKFRGDCLYALNANDILINPKWKIYLLSNAAILKDFCYWNLAMYLQGKNPSVPDIPNKLKKPAKRNSLTRQRKLFWDIVLQELGTIKCIYTNEPITIENYALEHFLPYAFVSHDLIWNLIPANKSYNSSKSDKLPRLEKHFDSFFNLQRKAIEIIKRKAPDNKLLTDYLTVFPDIDKSITKQKFVDVVQPLISIALNNGFQYNE